MMSPPQCHSCRKNEECFTLRLARTDLLDALKVLRGIHQRRRAFNRGFRAAMQSLDVQRAVTFGDVAIEHGGSRITAISPTGRALVECISRSLGEHIGTVRAMNGRVVIRKLCADALNRLDRVCAGIECSEPHQRVHRAVRRLCEYMDEWEASRHESRQQEGIGK